MDWKNAFVSCLVVIISHNVWSSELPPPQRVEVKSSVLKWKPPPGEGNLTYTVQYRKVPGQEWHSVCGCNQTQFHFKAATEDFYGSILRVRAETTNQTSAWVISNQVQCEHTEMCAPQLNLTVKMGKVYLWTGHKDQSLIREYGGHITFKALYWRKDGISDKQERDVEGGTLPIGGLESGQEYCFQVVYQTYNKPYGNPSPVICEVIPLSSTQKNIQIIVVGVLIVLGLFGCGVFIYCFYKNYKKVKLCLQPPLDIPDHIQKFFSEEIPHQELVCYRSQRVEVDNLVMFVSEDIGEEEQDRSDPTFPEEHSSHVLPP